MVPDLSGSMGDKPKRGDEMTFDGKLTELNAVLEGMNVREIPPLDLSISITDGGEACTWNQGGLYVAVFTHQHRPDPSSNVRIEVWFINNTIEPSYFSDCLRKAFSRDRDVNQLLVEKREIIFTSSSELTDAEKKLFLEIKSGMLLAKLSQHPRWGQPDGPNLAAVHEVLE